MITEEKRQELIADCKELNSQVDFWGHCSGFDAEKLILISQIALTSLQAKPVCSTSQAQLDMLAEGPFIGSLFGANDLDINLYSAPPVPVLKIPDDLRDAFEIDNKTPSQTSRCGEKYVSHSFNNWDGQDFMRKFDGFVMGVNYMKRLNGISDV